MAIGLTCFKGRNRSSPSLAALREPPVSSQFRCCHWPALSVSLTALKTGGPAADAAGPPCWSLLKAGLWPYFITLASPPGVDRVATSRYWAGTASSIVDGSSLFAVACLFWKSHSRLIPVV